MHGAVPRGRRTDVDGRRGAITGSREEITAWCGLIDTDQIDGADDGTHVARAERNRDGSGGGDIRGDQAEYARAPRSVIDGTQLGQGLRGVRAVIPDDADDVATAATTVLGDTHQQVTVGASGNGVGHVDDSDIHPRAGAHRARDLDDGKSCLRNHGGK